MGPRARENIVFPQCDRKMKFMVVLTIVCGISNWSNLDFAGRKRGATAVRIVYLLLLLYRLAKDRYKLSTFDINGYNMSHQLTQAIVFMTIC